MIYEQSDDHVCYVYLNSQVVTTENVRIDFLIVKKE